MVSLNGVCVGFLLLVLFITCGSARKIISEDVMLDESKRGLSEESQPSAGEPVTSDDVWVPQPVQENSNEELEVTHEPGGEPMSLGYAEVAPVGCRWPACGRPQPIQIPSSPCGCGGPNYLPPNPCQQPCSPLPPLNQPPQPGCQQVLPPQQGPVYQPPLPGCQQGLPPQQAPAYQPPQPGCQQGLPPQQAPVYQPPQTEPGCQQGLPPQQNYPQPAPVYPPQANPGCEHSTLAPQPAPVYQPWPAPQPAPFYPPQTEPNFPPPLADPNCILGCPPANAESSNVSELDHDKKDDELDHEKKDGELDHEKQQGSMNEEEMFSSPSPKGG